MQKITIVTGNKHKLAEWRRMMPSDFELSSADVDLDEIQSLDPRKVVEDKVKRAYEQLGLPVIVEDITAGIDHLNGLPGPFIKFFEQQLGKEALYILAGSKKMPATVSCLAAFYDGKNMLFGSGSLQGTVVSARGQNGFGFDFVFVPNGQSKTYAEMTHAEKDTISHRSLAIKDLVIKLKKL